MVTVHTSLLHYVGFAVIHETVVTVLFPSSPLTVDPSTEIVILPSLRTVVVSFEKLGLVVYEIVKAQPGRSVANSSSPVVPV